MGRADNQKVKILYVLKALWEESDENHPISAENIAKKVSADGINCERKSVYSDIEELREFGFDIISTKKGSYIASRQFELPELKLLADAVQASKFITEKKSQELVEKLSGLTNKYNAGQLRGPLLVRNRVKTMNESIYYNIDGIQEAMQKDCQISFSYYKWNIDKKMVSKKESEYRISPWILQWEDEKYYLVGYDKKMGIMKHFRVDKMKQIEILSDKRCGSDMVNDSKMSLANQEYFGMYSGRKATVTLQMREELAGVMLDRFGKDVWMHSVENGRLQVVIDVAISNQFFGWLAGLGADISIEKPAWVREEYKALLTDILEKGNYL